MVAQDRFDIVVLGASGFTGQLACEYLIDRGPPGLRWAMAGRNRFKLERFRNKFPKSAREVDILIVDVTSTEQLHDMARKTKVVANFAGTPFIDKGLPVVEACVEVGCCYVDITGEVPFMKTSADRFDEKAKETGALVVHACGFDSVPFDLGAMMAARALKERHGMDCTKIRCFNLDSKGAFSGGTLYTGLYLMSHKNVENADAAENPYGLDPPGCCGGPDTGSFGEVTFLPRYVELGNAWAIPFVMAPVNTKVVRKSNSLFDYAYGRAASVGEVMQVPGPVSGFMIISAMLLLVKALVFPPTRWALKRWVLPLPGQGPSKEMQNTGYFRLKVVALGQGGDAAPRTVVRIESGDGGDPGYKCTARMAIESALCCALERDSCRKPGGVVTPAVAFGQVLVDRLNASGMKLCLE